MNEVIMHGCQKVLENIKRKNIKFITSGRRPWVAEGHEWYHNHKWYFSILFDSYAWFTFINFKYDPTIWKKNHFECMIEKKNININTTSGKTHYFFSIIYLRPKKIIKSHTSWYTYRSYLKFMNGTYSCTCAVVY